LTDRSLLTTASSKPGAYPYERPGNRGRAPSRPSWGKQRAGFIGSDERPSASVARCPCRWGRRSSRRARGGSTRSATALLFYGTTLLVAALRGYAGCEVLALSNWLLRRDDHGRLPSVPADRPRRATPGLTHAGRDRIVGYGRDAPVQGEGIDATGSSDEPCGRSWSHAPTPTGTTDPKASCWIRPLQTFVRATRPGDGSRHPASDGFSNRRRGRPWRAPGRVVVVLDKTTVSASTDSSAESQI
jgi:hypothetical protein